MPHQLAHGLQKPTDIRCVSTELFFLPVQTRIPLKFGTEVVTSVTCARAKVIVVDRSGRSAEGWGETPISVQWVWPSPLPYEERHQILLNFCKILAREWAEFDAFGHPISVGYRFQRERLAALLKADNATRDAAHAMPWLAALVCCSAYDIAFHDAFGVLLNKPVYETYSSEHMNDDLSFYMEPAEKSGVDFRGKFPSDYLIADRPKSLAAWHLIGGLDRIHASDQAALQADDGHPTLLSEWIKRDGLKCLKIKLKGNDLAWDMQRIVEAGLIAIENGANWLSTDFNCTVENVTYVNRILDWLMAEHPQIYGMILYVEQPFPYEIEEHPIDVHSVSARKPLFMDESAHDWHMVKLGRELGWTGVALKTCKTQTGALLSACFARAHGMTLMVQDLTNPMLAMIPHTLLAAHVGTIMGVETNASQFYPAASDKEARVHPGLYQRRNGRVDLTSLGGPGFGYRIAEIGRELGKPVCRFYRN